jgi:uncharacterized protein YqeY
MTKKKNTKSESVGEKIGSYLPIFSGFYNTIFEPQEDSVIEHPYKYDDYDFDYKEYQQDMSKECVGIVEGWLKDFDIKVKFEELISPREYNYGNDSINVEYTLGKDSMKKILDYLEENKEAFAEYIKKRYTSRSGFISSYSSDSNEWITDLKDESSLHHKLGSVLEFILENEQHDEYELYEKASGNVFLMGELKQEVKDNQEYIENYAKEHYTDKSQDEIAEDVMNYFNDNGTDYSEKTVKKIIKETFSEVEDKSMKMFGKGGKASAGKWMTDYSKVSYIPSDTAHKQEPLIIGLTEDNNIYYVNVNNNRNHWNGQPEPSRGFSMSGSTADILTYSEAKKYAKEFWEDFFHDKREMDDMNERLGTNFRSAKSASQHVLNVDGELAGFDDDRQLGEVDYKNKKWIFQSQSGGQIDDYMNPDKLKRIYVDEKTLTQLRDMWKNYHLKKLPAKMEIPVVEQDKEAILIDAIKTAREKECGGDVTMAKGGIVSRMSSFFKSYAEDGGLIFGGYFPSGSKMEKGGEVYMSVSPEKLHEVYHELYPSEAPKDFQKEGNIKIFGNWLNRYKESPEMAIATVPTSWQGKMTKALFKALDILQPKTKPAMLEALKDASAMAKGGKASKDGDKHKYYVQAWKKGQDNIDGKKADYNSFYLSKDKNSLNWDEAKALQEKMEGKKYGAVGIYAKKDNREVSISLGEALAKGGAIKNKKINIEVVVPKAKKSLLEDNAYELREFIAKSLTKEWFGHGAFDVETKKIADDKITLTVKIPAGKEYSVEDEFEFTEFLSKKLTKNWFGTGAFSVSIVK